MAALGSLLLVTLFFVVALSETDRCYFPNGELAESAARCWDATLGPTSLCCQSGDLCLNNTLCANMNGGRYTTYYRGSCISSSWSDPGCPNFCDNPFEDDQIVQVLPRSDAQPPTQWGCGGDCFELSGSLAVYATAGITPLSFPLVISATPSTAGDSTESQDAPSTTAPSDSIQPSPVPPSAETTEPTTSSSSKAPLYVSWPDTTVGPSSTTTPAQHASETGSPTSTPSSASPGSGGSVSQSSAPSSAPKDDGKASLAIPIGVGVGIGTSVLIAASALVFFYQRKRRRQAPVRAETPPPFEFSAINNEAPGWPAAPHGAKLPELPENERRVAEIGGTARFELP